MTQPKQTEKKKPGRREGYRKADPLCVRKGVRLTREEGARLDKALEVTGESASDFIRQAVDDKSNKVLATAGIDPTTI